MSRAEALSPRRRESLASRIADARKRRDRAPPPRIDDVQRWHQEQETLKAVRKAKEQRLFAMLQRIAEQDERTEDISSPRTSTAIATVGGAVQHPPNRIMHIRLPCSELRNWLAQEGRVAMVLQWIQSLPTAVQERAFDLVERLLLTGSCETAGLIGSQGGDTPNPDTITLRGLVNPLRRPDEPFQLTDVTVPALILPSSSEVTIFQTRNQSPRSSTGEPPLLPRRGAGNGSGNLT
uniref:Uncharacterized protein n=1 Tax=Haptolina ericina TaxID=156174 RepID=A0A7S3AHZ0_9EUKA|mmetsp:Transcript_16100/g.36078  ORF Transcript_16100/g.36078 Transcript_16100/m.36078 type:complete len:236 (+) Transcript_16100:41-748(+)|eukprot:CAMPEP_0181184970 /NCGR_PEP_ID=MMETSP1096-20121128/9258_1 /TAXON_ID=156174 ORGANISM="Chrysochromulina ericina, Strain CCMP281" /NCGR_SAMPLE_ID=MMETSP1096 /ASSEMBLY_ACC=CAM_ASM_000453 /LENGTH=235 /DNA_ID=CAMNT_0023273783 /DNA_START=41 /DNA_END=748 /DNA_ORIENTATION=-